MWPVSKLLVSFAESIFHQGPFILAMTFILIYKSFTFLHCLAHNFSLFQILGNKSHFFYSETSEILLPFSPSHIQSINKSCWFILPNFHTMHHLIFHFLFLPQIQSLVAWTVSNLCLLIHSLHRPLSLKHCFHLHSTISQTPSLKTNSPKPCISFLLLA